MIGGSIAAVLVMALIGWKILTPSAEEDDQAVVISQIKTDGDHLAAEGKQKQAFEKYTQVRNLAAGRDIKSKALRATVEAANTAREAIRRDNPSILDKAQTAKSGG